MGTYEKAGPKRPEGETRAIVAEKLAQGLSIREIALILGISTQAVYQHKDRIDAERSA